MNILGGLDRPSAGGCVVGGIDLVKAPESELVYYKRYKVGFVWQQAGRNLIPYLTAFRKRPGAHALRQRIGSKSQGVRRGTS